MPRKVKSYARLPGRQLITLAGRSSLWLGEDHLLHVRDNFIAEEYKRFYYADIQSMVFNKTPAGAVFNALFGGSAALFVLLSAANPIHIAAVGWFFAAVLFILFLVNLILGPTCKCYIGTGIQKETISSLGRLRAAQKALSLIKGKVHQAQGRLTQTEIQERMGPAKKGEGKNRPLQENQNAGNAATLSPFPSDS